MKTQKKRTAKVDEPKARPTASVELGGGFSDEDATAAQAAIDAGEPIARVAERYGKSERGLRHTLTRRRNSGDSLSNARRSIGNDGPTGGEAEGARGPTASPEKGAPAPEDGLTEEQRRAIVQFERYFTPEVVVDTIDGFQTSMLRMGCHLGGVGLNEKEQALLPFTKEEKAGLVPWAAFAMGSVSDELKKDPSLGFKVFGIVLLLTLSQRGFMIASVVKAQRARAKMKKAPEPKPSPEDETGAPAKP